MRYSVFFFYLNAFFCAVLVEASQSSSKPLQQKSGNFSQQRPPIVVTTLTATITDVPLYIEALGHTRAYEEVHVVPQVAGEILAIHFVQGQAVQVGHVLFSLDPRAYAIAVEKAKADLAKAQSQLKIDEAQCERSKVLVPGSYISPQEFEAQEARLGQSRANFQLAQAQLNSALLNLEHCSVKAPIAGTTGPYEVDTGSFVMPGLVKSLVTIRKMDPLYVEFSISENEFPLVKEYFRPQRGLEVRVHPLADSTQKMEGRLWFLPNVIDPATGNVLLRAEIFNPQRVLWPGESVSVKLLLKLLYKVVLLPESCIRLGQQGHYVFIVKEDQTVELRLIKKGQRHGDRVAVLKGISAGENVVETGQMMLAPGVTVKVVPKP